MALKEVTQTSLEKGAKRDTGVFCIQEMMSVFDCYEKHEFKREPCENLVKALEQCYSINMDKRLEGKDRRRELNHRGKK